MSTTKILTAAAVLKKRPASKRQFIPDGTVPCLFLVIQTSGHKAWMMRMPSGKMVLGPVDFSGKEIDGEPVIGMPLTLVGARHLAAKIHRERALGRDPVADHKRTRKGRGTGPAGTTFGVLVNRYIGEHAKPKTRKWRYSAKLLGLDYPLAGGKPVATPDGLVQRWGSRNVSGIHEHEVHEVIMEAQRFATPGIPTKVDGPSDARARDFHDVLSSFFGWCHRHRLVIGNPVSTVFRPAKSRPRDRVLTPEEIVRFWQACGKVGPMFGAALKLLLLTGCRLNEIARLRHDEVNDDVIVLPSSRTKNHRTHIIPLAPLARQILAGTPRIEACPYVFSTNGRAPLGGWNKIKKKLDENMKVTPWVLHDLRRTAVTQMAELGIAPHVIELCVNHISGTRGGIAGVYNRAEMMPQREDAMEKWAREVERLLGGKPAQVVQLNPR